MRSRVRKSCSVRGGREQRDDRQGRDSSQSGKGAIENDHVEFLVSSMFLQNDARKAKILTIRPREYAEIDSDNSNTTKRRDDRLGQKCVRVN